MVPAITPAAPSLPRSPQAAGLPVHVLCRSAVARPRRPQQKPLWTFRRYPRHGTCNRPRFTPPPPPPPKPQAAGLRSTYFADVRLPPPPPTHPDRNKSHRELSIVTRGIVIVLTPASRPLPRQAAELIDSPYGSVLYHTIPYPTHTLLSLPPPAVRRAGHHAVRMLQRGCLQHLPPARP